MFGWILKTDWDIHRLMDLYTKRVEHKTKLDEMSPVSGA
jgi:hypothetical protein